MSQTWVKIWPRGLHHRRTQVGRKHVSWETVTNTSNRILISCKLTQIWQFMCFWHFAKRSKSIFLFRHLEAIYVWADLRIPTILIPCWEMSEIWSISIEISWPHFSFSRSRSRSRKTFWHFCYSLCRGLPPQQKSAYQHFWADLVTNIQTYTRMHHTKTVRAIYSSFCKKWWN